MIFNRFNRVYFEAEKGGEEGGGGGGKPELTPEQIAAAAEQESGKPNEEEASKGEKPNEQEKDTKLPEKEVDKSKLGQVTGLIEKAGLSMKEVAEYAKANDGKVDLDTMVALKEKHGDAIASLIADQIKGIHTERSEAASKRDTEVYDQVKEAFKDITSDPEQTGESMWTELATWTKGETEGQPNVSNDHRAEINAMLAQGGLAAKLAVQELTTAFKESIGKNEFQEAALLDGDAQAPSGSGKDISKFEYNAELNKLTNAGHQYGESREIAALDARRTKSIQRGIK